MDYPQIALAVVTFLATIVLVVSTVSFHRWTRRQHSPSPVVVDIVMHLRQAKQPDEAYVKSVLTLWNPSTVPVMIESVRLALSGAEPAPTQKSPLKQRVIPPGHHAEIPLRNTWSWVTMEEVRNIIVKISYRTGETAGTLIVGGMKSPSVIMLESPDTQLEHHPGPELAYVPKLVFTYPHTRLGRFAVRLRRSARMMPDDVFDRWRK
jgi:hypothetical protein